VWTLPFAKGMVTHHQSGRVTRCSGSGHSQGYEGSSHLISLERGCDAVQKADLDRGIEAVHSGGVDLDLLRFRSMELGGQRRKKN